MRIALLGLLALAAATLIRNGLRYRHSNPLLPKKYNFGKRGVTLRETLRPLTDCRRHAHFLWVANQLLRDKAEGD